MFPCMIGHNIQGVFSNKMLSVVTFSIANKRQTTRADTLSWAGKHSAARSKRGRELHYGLTYLYYSCKDAVHGIIPDQSRLFRLSKLIPHSVVTSNHFQ